MQVFPQFENLFSENGYLGEAPQLSPIYGQYDNMHTLDPLFYDNFIGTTINSSLWYENLPADVSVNNGLTLSASNANAPIIATKQSFNGSYGMTIFGKIGSGTGSGAFFFGLQGYDQSASNLTGNLWISRQTNDQYYNATNGVLSSTGSISSSSGKTGEHDYSLFTGFSGGSASYIVVRDGKQLYNGSFVTPYSAGNYGFRSYSATTFYQFVLITNVPANGMPTASISSSGSDYMANATTSSTFQGQPGGAYNSTWSYYNFQVPISPNTDYATVIWNSGWQLSNLYPQTYAPVLNGQNFATFSSLKGYTMIQVSLIMPSPQIGSPSTISVEPEQNNNSLYLQNLHLSMTYTPFGSSTQENLTAFGTLVSLPYGSTASFSLYNQWNQLMGADYGVLIDSTSATLPIAVSARTVTFNFENSTTNQVSIIANGITVSGFFGSATLATGYKYTWTTQVYDLYLGKNVNYSGIINDTQNEVNISTNAPPSSLSISVNAYGPSNQGELGVPGTPPVLLRIDGSLQDVGSTFIGFVGSTYNITITDVLGQTLYTKDLRLVATSVSLQADINVSSWQFSIQNQELVNSASPLATEHISLNLSGSTSTYYNFTNQVGSTATLYLKQGNYHLYLHDNATFNTTFNLSQNRNYVIFGQNLLTYAEWQKDFNQILNDTSGLQIQTVHSDSELQPGQAADYSFKAFFANSSQLSDAELQQSNIITQVTNSSGPFSLSYTTVISGGVVYVNFSAPAAGSYTISSAVLYSSTIGGRVSYGLIVQPIITASKGIILSGAGPSGSLTINQSYNFTVSVDYGNLSAMNLHDTESVYNNMTFTIYNGIDPVQEVKKLNYYAGIITFSALFNQSGVFSLYIQSHADLNGSDFGTAIIPVSVNGVSASALQGSLSVPSSPTANTTAVIAESFQYLNGTSPGNSTMQSIFGNTTLKVQIGSKSIQEIRPSSMSGSTLYFSLYEPAGSYIIVAQTNLSGAIIEVGSIHFVPLSPGQIIIQFSGSQVQTNSSNTIVMNMFFQSNGAVYSLTEQQTKSIMHNLTVELEYNGNFYGFLSPYYITPGMVGMDVNVTQASAHYSLNASISGTNISGILSSGKGSASFTAYPYNPSTPPYGISQQQLANILSSPAAIAIGLIASVLGVLAFLIPQLRKRHDAEVEDVNQAALVVQGNLATKILEGKPLSPMEQAWWNAIPNETRKKLMKEGTAGNRSLFPRFSPKTPPNGRGKVN